MKRLLTLCWPRSIITCKKQEKNIVVSKFKIYLKNRTHEKVETRLAHTWFIFRVKPMWANIFCYRCLMKTKSLILFELYTWNEYHIHARTGIGWSPKKLFQNFLRPLFLQIT
jgi:hypothetical protein